MADKPFPEQALAQHTAILGKTGSGKTFTAKLAVEQLVADGGRVCILDPIKSDWWGLTSSADGKRPGLEFSILGGPHGHVPLPSSSGAAVGELVATGALRLSIVDMADFEPGGLQRFFVDFAGALLRHMRGVVHLVIEEAHEIAPKERSGIGAENMAIHWAKKLALAGRSKGIRLILATQRTQSLHNALLNSCETMIVHRTIAPGDKQTIVGWFKDNATKDQAAEVSRSLSSLKTGTAWLSSGEAGIFEQRQFPRIATFDNSATPTSDGTRRAVITAPVDRDHLRAVIGDAVKEAEGNDPAKLKMEIAGLKATIEAQGKPSAKPPANMPSAERVGELLGRIERLETEQVDVLEENRRMRATMEIVADEISGMATDIREHLVKLPTRPAAATAPRPRPTPPAPRQAGTPAFGSQVVTVREVVAPASGSSTPEAKVLAALAFWRSVGYDAPTRPQIAAVAGYSHDTGNFRAVVGRISTAGYVDIPAPGQLTLRPGAPVVGLTAAQARARLFEILGAPEQKLLMAAFSESGECSRALLAELTGYSADTGNFRAIIGRLCTLQVFTKPGPARVAVSNWARKLIAG